MKKTLLLSLLGIFVSLVTMAQLPEAGKYYRIVNQNPDKSITTGGERYGFVITEDPISNALKASEQGGDTQYNQLWKYTGSKFQNAQTQRYFNTLSMSVQGYTSTTGASVTFEEKSGNYILICGQPAHADGSNAIVGWWDKNNSSNWWKFEEVAVDAADLKAAQDEYKQQQAEKAALMQIVNKANVITPIVESYFEDKACLTLKSEYAAMSDEDFKAKMTTDQLPERIQDMVITIKNKWAGEFNPTLSERFRVQNYKIYTRCDDAGTNGKSPKSMWKATQMSDRNNPTGIWTDAVQLVYVFVESEIPEGATLKIAQASGAGVIGLFDYQGTELHQGMNIIYCGLNYTTHWIMYTCAADYTKPLSTYPEMKIHIEGGEVLGYVTKKPGNEEATNAEYELMLKNATALMKARDKDPNNINFTVKGERGVFEFPVECYDQIWSSRKWGGKISYGYNIYKSINFYDSVLKWEWSNMGWQARVENGEANNDLEKLAPGGGDAIWPTYVNNLAPTMQAPDGKNPYSGNSHTGMPGIGAVESSYNAERADFDVWCCGHESGHNNQGTINLPSCTESSNNYFSNIITSQYGYRLSRGWSFSQNYNNYVNQKIVFCQRDISITMRMYYNLWLYYHQVGKNKQFSPKLFKLLREDPMEFGGEGWYSGKLGTGSRGSATTSWLKFYEKACEAAGEDLTEYFRMWGFLTPTSEAGGDYIEKIGDKYYAYCGDYSSYYVRCDKEDVDAAIARVKAKGYPENLQIMFVEDRQIQRQRHDPWAKTGDMKYYNWGAATTPEGLKSEYGDVGDILTFIDGSANTSSYTYILSGNTVSLTGKGGVGFILRDKDGNIAFMSNKYEFDIPTALAKDGFTIEALNADGTKSEIADGSATASPAVKKEILQKAIAMTTAYTELEDATGKKVGYYSSEELAAIKGMVSDAQKAIRNGDVENYLALANSINNEVLRLMDEDPSLHIVPNALYNINSKRLNGGSTRYLAGGSSSLSATTSGSSNSAKWAFVPVNDGSDGKYYMQNRSNSKLIGAVTNEKNNVTGTTMLEEKPQDLAVVTVTPLGNGVFGLRPMDKTHINIDPSNNIAVWGSADEGSQWYITLSQEFEEVNDEMINNLKQLANDLIEDICDYTLTKEDYTLQVDDPSQPGYLSTNQPSTTNPLANAIDGKSYTYFMSNKDNNSATTEPHHLKVDLGSSTSNRTNFIRFSIQGNTANRYAKKINIYGSTTPTMTPVKVATVDITGSKFTSDPIRTSTKYRIWRFDVVETQGSGTDTSTYPWFTVVKFTLSNMVENVEFKPGFETEASGITSSQILTLKERIDDATVQQNKDFRTMMNDWLIYTPLKSSYESIYKKAIEIDGTVGIDGIDADETEGSSNEIYDLSGRRLNDANGKGVYIIGGKKVIR